MSHRFVFSEGALTLNDEQARIVRQPPTQNLRILASAGSGKTTTLTARIAHLLTNCGAKPHQIILLTFTHNAAAVMCQRLEALIGCQRILCGTFHALSQQILKHQNPSALQDLYHVDELPLKALDFLTSPVGKQWVTGINWLFIDEFQDINDTQYKFIRALHHERSTITIVGDDAQNIYSWRGSCVDYILNFHTKFQEVADFQLSTNYRSTTAIVAVANSIMRYIPTLEHKELMTAASIERPCERPFVQFFARTSEERDWVCENAFKAKGTTVILSKFNSVLYAYEAALLKLGIRVRFVQDQGQHDQEHEKEKERTIFLSTFHGSKGLEWDNVFLVRMNDEVFPQQKDEDGILQERRLFYVAVTRARCNLTLTYSKNPKSLSRFIREIHRPLLQWHGLPNYDLSTLTSNITPATIDAWISVLTGEDYRTIKQLNLLPASLKDALPQVINPITAYVTPYWWTEQGMTTEFYDFLRAFWQREVATHRPDAGAQWDRTAQSVIWTIKIAAEDATFFEAHRSLFETLADRFFGATPRGASPPQIYYTEVIAAIPQSISHPMEQSELIRVIQIIHKMRTVLYNLRFANIALTDLRFAAIRHSPPQESRCQLIEAWRLYSSAPTSETSRPVLNAIYLIGLCRALSEGRSGVLTNLPGEKEWARCRTFLEELRATIATLMETSKKQPVISRVQVPLVDNVIAEADMVIGTTAWFFVSGDQPGELNRLDRILGILLTVHALRRHGHRITHFHLHQIITGLSLKCALEDWQPSASALLAAFVQARCGYASSAN